MSEPPVRIGLVRSPLGDDSYRLWEHGEDGPNDAAAQYVRSDIVDEMLLALEVASKMGFYHPHEPAAADNVQQRVDAAIARAKGSSA